MGQLAEYTPEIIALGSKQIHFQGNVRPIASLIAFACFFVPSLWGSTAAKSIHVVSCEADAVQKVAAREFAQGYVVTRVRGTIVDGPRVPSAGITEGNLYHHENVLLFLEQHESPVSQKLMFVQDSSHLSSINDSTAPDMRLDASNLVPLRNWGFGLDVEGYIVVLNKAADNAHYSYSAIDLSAKDAEQKSISFYRDGYRPVAVVAPAVLVLEKAQASASPAPRFTILQGYDAQHIQDNLKDAAHQGYSVITASTSRSGLLVSLLMTTSADASQIQYEVSVNSNISKIEANLNQAAQKGYLPAPGGVLAVRATPTRDRGLIPPPESVMLILQKSSGARPPAYRVLEVTPKNALEKLQSLGSEYSLFDYISLSLDRNFLFAIK